MVGQNLKFMQISSCFLRRAHIFIFINIPYYVVKGYTFFAPTVHIRLIYLIQFQILDFTCSVDADCHKGYCENQKCYCLDGFNLKEDCSVYGCKSKSTDTISNDSP